MNSNWPHRQGARGGGEAGPTVMSATDGIPRAKLDPCMVEKLTILNNLPQELNTIQELSILHHLKRMFINQSLFNQQNAIFKCEKYFLGFGNAVVAEKYV